MSINDIHFVCGCMKQTITFQGKLVFELTIFKFACLCKDLETNETTPITIEQAQNIIASQSLWVRKQQNDL